MKPLISFFTCVVPRGVNAFRVPGSRRTLVRRLCNLPTAFHGAGLRSSASRPHWYDSEPHAEDPDVPSNFPHHTREPPDITHNRRPAPGISFQSSNLPTLIADCMALGEA